MKAPNQNLFEWLQSKSADLVRAISFAEAKGLAATATSSSRLRDRILLRFERFSIETPSDAERDFSALRGQPEPSGSRLSDIAWWLGCEENDGATEHTLGADSISAFLREYEPRVLRFVSSKFAARDEELAESITEATFCHVYRYYWSRASRARYLGEARAISLLRVIARNEALKQIRDRRRHEEMQDDFIIPGPVGVDPTDEEFEERLSRALADCFDELPPRCKVIASRRYRDGQAPGEIARAMGIGAAAVTNQSRRAVEILQSCLSGKGIKAGDIACLADDGDVS